MPITISFVGPEHPLFGDVASTRESYKVKLTDADVAGLNTDGIRTIIVNKHQWRDTFCTVIYTDREDEKLSTDEPVIRALFALPKVVDGLHLDTDLNVADRMEELRAVAYEQAFVRSREAEFVHEMNKSLVKQDASIAQYRQSKSGTASPIDVFRDMFMRLIDKLGFPQGEFTKRDVERYLLEGKL